MGDIIQSITENAIRIIEKKRLNAFRRGVAGFETGIGLSRGRGDGGG
jgi:hypothetical protein